MVEFVLISIAIVAVISLAVNLRALGGHKTELPALNGNAHWERGELTSLEHTGDYLGVPTAKLVFTMKERDHELSGPLPPTFAEQIRPGLAVEGHVEYDLLDTVRTELWDASPLTVLTECAARLDVSTTPSAEAPHTLTVNRAGQSLEICLADDGWLMLTHTVSERQDVSVDLRADFDVAENAHMLTDRLGIMPDDAEHTDALARLSSRTLQELEQFVTGLEGWVCIDHDAIDLECALPFPHAELIVKFVEDLGPLMALVEAELRTDSDGVW